jgi:4-hydroxymandelate oxidase
MIGKLLSEGNSKLGGRKSGAETGSVLKMTRDYIDSLSIEMRVIDSAVASTEMKLFGETFSTPVMVAALSGLGNGMVETAKGAGAAGSVMWAGIGDEAELKAMVETGAKVIKIIKPYRDRNLIFKKIAQAEEDGAFAVGMDIDFVFGGEIEDSLIRPELMGPKTFDDIKSFVKATKLPFILKGVLSEQDARKALEAGAAAIVVSHHGGSVLDYAVPPLKILPHIVNVIDRKIPVFVDCGIIRGTDVFKALALGASGVLVGRTVIAGLAASGAEGVQKILEGTNEELRRVMNLTGSPDIESIDSKLIWGI